MQPARCWLIGLLLNCQTYVNLSAKLVYFALSDSVIQACITYGPRKLFYSDFQGVLEGSQRFCPD